MALSLTPSKWPAFRWLVNVAWEWRKLQGYLLSVMGKWDNSSVVIRRSKAEHRGNIFYFHLLLLVYTSCTATWDPVLKELTSQDLLTFNWWIQSVIHRKPIPTCITIKNYCFIHSLFIYSFTEHTWHSLHHLEKENRDLYVSLIEHRVFWARETWCDLLFKGLI